MSTNSNSELETFSSFSILKEFPVPVANPEYTIISGRDIIVPRHPDLPCTSRYVDAALDYLRGLKISNGDLPLLRFRAHRVGAEFVLEFQIEREMSDLVEDFRPLPDLYLQIVCSMWTGFNGTKLEIFEERVYLEELYSFVANGAYHEPYQLFSKSGPMEGTVTCDLILGWSDGYKKVETPIIKTSAKSLLENMFGLEETKDLTIVAGNGSKLKCHRMVFEAHNDVLAAMVSPLNGMVESETGTIKLPENSEQGLTHLIRYLYGMELSPDELSCDVAVELFKTADKYRLTDLLDGVGQMLHQQKIDWFTPDDLLELYFHVRNLDGFQKLEEYLLKRRMLRMPEDIRSCERFKELTRDDPLSANDFVWKMFNLNTAKLEKMREQDLAHGMAY